jgi:uncharacterized membrane protein YfcA
MTATLEPTLGWIAAGGMGLTLGLLGGGGAILTVPILVYLFGHTARLATLESLIVVGFVSIIGLIPYARRRRVDARTGLLFALPSLFGVLAARRLLLPMIPDSLSLFGGATLSKDSLLLVSFAVVMLLASRSMLRRRPAVTATPPTLESENPPVPPAAIPMARILSQGLLVGGVTGFVGAGGGFLIVPALSQLLKLPMDRAIGTSLFIIAINSLFGFFTSLTPETAQSLDPLFLGSLIFLASGGVLTGGRINQRIPTATLRKAFGVFIILMGLGILGAQLF